MPGRKRRFSARQDRQARHVADSERARGMDPEEARAVGYATVNKYKRSGRRSRRSGRR